MNRLHDERGWALVTALLLMLIMSGFAMASFAFVDTQQRESGVTRQRETAFNVAEAALNAQIFKLSQQPTTAADPAGWPGRAQRAYPASCTQASTDVRCPTSATLQSLFGSPDVTPSMAWTTHVRDNSGASGAETFWSESLAAGGYAYDANGDGRLWVRAESLARGHRRTMVALVRTQPQNEDLPHVAVLAGRMSIANNGNKVIVDTRGSGTVVGPVQVRCTPVIGESTPCLGHRLTVANQLQVGSLLGVQIAPYAVEPGITAPSALAADALERLRQTAIGRGTYHTSCPASLAGELVFIDTPAGTACAYTGNDVVNSKAAPGAVIMTRGTLTVGGGTIFWGLLYHANLDSSTGAVVGVAGQAEIHGGTIVDGPGTLFAGSSKVNFVFEDLAFSNLRSDGGAGLVQNTWRELR